MSPQKLRAILKKAGFPAVHYWKSGEDSRGRAFRRCWPGYRISMDLRVQHIQEIHDQKEEQEFLTKYQSALESAGVRCWVARYEIIVAPDTTPVPSTRVVMIPQDELALL